jgi:predicted S18 family serine protease
MKSWIPILLLLLILSLSANIYLATVATTPAPEMITDLQGRVNTLERENTVLKAQIDQNNHALGSYSIQLDSYRAMVNALEQRAACAAPGMSGAASLDAPAVLQQIEEEQDGPVLTSEVPEVGAMITIAVEIVPGKGRVLVETTPLMGVIFQDAANTAVFIAQNKTNVSLTQSDIIFSIAAEDEIPAVDGPSAGALMTLLVIAALNGDDLQQDVTLTGTIDETGGVGRIGGVIAKAEAARDAGKTLLILPQENREIVRFVQEMTRINGISVIRQRPETIDTESYIEETVGIEVAFADDIDEVRTLVVAD